MNNSDSVNESSNTNDSIDNSTNTLQNREKFNNLERGTAVSQDRIINNSSKKSNKISPEVLAEPHISIKTKKGTIMLGYCHRIPSRSFHWKGKPILCYRCLGLYSSFYLVFIIQILGLIIGLLNIKTYWIELTHGSYSIMFLISLGLSLPYIIDGGLQALTRWESKNPIRFITGIMGGTGQGLFFITLGLWLKSIFR